MIRLVTLTLPVLLDAPNGLWLIATPSACKINVVLDYRKLAGIAVECRTPNPQEAGLLKNKEPQLQSGGSHHELGADN